MENSTNLAIVKGVAAKIADKKLANAMLGMAEDYVILEEALAKASRRIADLEFLLAAAVKERQRARPKKIKLYYPSTRGKPKKQTTPRQ